jgi:putative transposase
VWPHTVVQTCVVHLIRAALRYVSHGDRKALAAAIRPIYTAPTWTPRSGRWQSSRIPSWGRRYPGAVAVWERAWDRFTPFLAFPEVRTCIPCTPTAS